MALTPEDRVMILAPIVRGRKGEFKKETEKLVQHGFTRARVDGEIVNLEDDLALDKRKNHTIEVVVDRLLVKQGIEHRLELSVGLAMKLAGGLVQVAVVGGEEQLFPSGWPVPIAALMFRSSSRVRFLSTVLTEPVLNAMDWVANMTSIRARSSPIGRSHCLTEGSARGQLPEI